MLGIIGIRTKKSKREQMKKQQKRNIRNEFIPRNAIAFIWVIYRWLCNQTNIFILFYILVYVKTIESISIWTMLQCTTKLTKCNDDSTTHSEKFKWNNYGDGIDQRPIECNELHSIPYSIPESNRIEYYKDAHNGPEEVTTASCTNVTILVNQQDNM